MHKNPKIVICGNYGAKNLGDEMILRGILELLQRIAPKAEITILSTDPQETKHLHREFQINAVHQFPAGARSIIRNLLDSDPQRAVKKCDFFILGGGGLFGNLTLRANLIWAIQAYWAYRFRKPVVMYGQSIGSLTNKLTRRIVRSLFNRAAYISVRDRASKDRLKDLGIRKKIHLVPDPALRLNHNESPHHRKNLTLIALRQIKGLNENFQNAIVDQLNKLNGELCFIDFHPSDNKIHKKIIAKISDSNRVRHIKNITIDEMLDLYTQAKLVVGMRLHSIIAALKTETPFTAINYADKVADMLEQYKLESALSSINNPQLDRIATPKIQFSNDLTPADQDLKLMLYQYNFRG